MKDYMGLNSQLIKKVIRGGPHRVAVICVLQTNWLCGIIWLIKLYIETCWICAHTKQAMAANAKAWLPNSFLQVEDIGTQTALVRQTL